ncbi:probable cyclic nucleotide-gated ion channel 16 [Chenopodium quinoa]|uniref:probable cyclic nucleotide-gated ion channel 16 n=1 Tax=Chenopodium quinoa TaxID=63459 RepID=UPI000B77A780|nr:probable cyclic nucleotide-gated ion channel 16 [Chenopodium quinoa]
MHSFQFYAPSSKIRHFPTSFSILRRQQQKSKPQWWTKIHDPRSEFITSWNNLFFITCLVTLFLDPLYFYVPTICGYACLNTNFELLIIVTLIRTICDFLYLVHIFLKFRTAFISRNSRVFGRKELVIDPKAIAAKYLTSDFIIDVAAMLPLPQTMIWFIVPALRSGTKAHTNHTVALIVLVQFIPRLFVMFPLNRKIVNSTGIAAKNAWSGAVYNMLLFILAGHVIGGVWYLWALQRVHTCWTIECLRQRNSRKFPCKPSFFDIENKNLPARKKWLDKSDVLTNCNPRNKDHKFTFGMFDRIITDDVVSAGFTQTYFYCLWWGLKTLSSYGQNIENSTYVEETLFCSFICVMGLFLFSHLIGQVQNYLQSIMTRIEEWRIRRRDTEEWMQHIQLPEELRERIRRFVQYKWLATRGVDEESILQSLPLDIRREIQKHLCLGLVRRVPFFAQMDDQLLDAICERLIPSLSTKDTYIAREGDPVSEMMFIIRGQLESSTTYGGRSGFFNSITLRQGDFCGEELLTWAILPTTTTLNLPSSTRKVKAITEVEAFALRADDLKYVATQFKRLQSKKLQHSFRYYSHQWRTWGACFIQAAWRRHQKRKLAEDLERHENYCYYIMDDDDDENNEDEIMYSEGDPLIFKQNDEHNDEDDDNNKHNQPLKATILASKFATNTKRGANQKVKIVDSSSHHDLKMPKMFKPEDPDFF